MVGDKSRRNRKIGSVSVSPKSVIFSRWSTNKPMPFINLMNFDESFFAKLLLMPSAMS